jgi:hypothetical protein
MNPLQRILFPTDFSQASVSMVPCAREMAQRFNAHLKALHAFELAPAYAISPHFAGECALQYLESVARNRSSNFRNLQPSTSLTSLTRLGLRMAMQPGSSNGSPNKKEAT